jgi:hypothetical protein
VVKPAAVTVRPLPTPSNRFADVDCVVVDIECTPERCGNKMSRARTRHFAARCYRYRVTHDLVPTLSNTQSADADAAQGSDLSVASAQCCKGLASFSIAIRRGGRGRGLRRWPLLRALSHRRSAHTIRCVISVFCSIDARCACMYGTAAFAILSRRVSETDGSFTIRT